MWLGLSSKNRVMKLASLEHLSLQRKFVIMTFSVVIFLMVVTGLIITRRESNIMYRDIERQGRLLAETLAIPVMNDLIYERLGLVEEGGLIDNYITGIFSKKEIRLIYIAVLDENGRIISHNDFNEYGRVYDDPITTKALASDSTVVQRFHDQHTNSGALDFSTPAINWQKTLGNTQICRLAGSPGTRSSNDRIGGDHHHSHDACRRLWRHSSLKQTVHQAHSRARTNHGKSGRGQTRCQGNNQKRQR